MEQLWAPWRLDYIQGERPDGCIFCLAGDAADDAGRLVLKRGRHAFIMMNRYPYSNGHLMVSPFRHLAEPEQLSDAEALEMHQLAVLCQRLLRRAVQAQAFNLGMNVGAVAGAGVADHLHLHIVPRWQGDTNFMPVFADVRVIPQHLEATWTLLCQTLAHLEGA